MSITSTSEMLLPALRAAISDGFGVPVIDMFGSTEGLVGVSDPDDPVLAFNSDACIVELVDDRHRPVAPGARATKILLTNLSNRVQPLIRYEMHDGFVQQPAAATGGHLRAIVEGRSDDMLRWDGVDVHPLVIRAVMVKSPEVVDYQVARAAGARRGAIARRPRARARRRRPPPAGGHGAGRVAPRAASRYRKAPALRADRLTRTPRGPATSGGPGSGPVRGVAVYGPRTR
jgi:hypothetical protein